MKLKNDILIKEWEALRLTAYKPTPNDVWTIGWGHTKIAKPGMSITKEKAQQLFEYDTAWAVAAVNNYVKVPLTQNQFDALVSFTFNIGAGAFKESTLLRKLNAGDYEGAAAEFPRWNKQTNSRTGKKEVLKGLVRRRAHEMELFLSAMGSSANPVNSEIVTGPDPLKPLTKSKELISGVATAVGGLTLSGVSGYLDQANTFVVGFSVALVAIGALLVVNRLRARNKGDR